MSRVLLVSSDLMARERVRSATERLGGEADFARPAEIGDLAGYDVVLLDLDEGRADLVAAVSGAPARVVGYFSHVDIELGRAAAAAGVEAVRRGRFWSDLPTYLS